jgi:2-oxoglutarate ferredoxin oxidoreductase subunit alpha
MTSLRAEKVESVAKYIPNQQTELGPDFGDLLILGWGSTYGPIYQAAHNTGASFAHLRYLNPMPKNLGSLLSRFRTVLVPEMNNGQLAALLRERIGVAPVSMTKVSGQPFMVSELVERIEQLQREVSA